MSRARTAAGAASLVLAIPLVVIGMVNADEWGNAPTVLFLLLGALGAALVVSGRPGADGSAGRAIGGATLGVGGVALAALLLIGGVLAIVFLFQTMFSGIADAIGDSINGGS